MSSNKKTLLWIWVAAYVVGVIAFFVHSAMQTEGGGVAYPLTQDLAKKDAHLAVPLEVQWTEGQAATAEMVGALQSAHIDTVRGPDGTSMIVSQDLVGRRLGPIELPEGTPVTKALWLTVLAPEAERLGDDATVSVTGKGELMSFNLTLIFVVLNFLGLLALLYLLLWDPILKTLDERTATIKGDLEAAAEKREQAQGLKSKYEELMLGSKQERQELVAEGRKEGEAERQRILTAAREEADKVIARTQEELEATAAQVRAGLQREIGGLSIELAERILGREVREEDNRQLVDDFLAKLDQVESSN